MMGGVMEGGGWLRELAAVQPSAAVGGRRLLRGGVGQAQPLSLSLPEGERISWPPQRGLPLAAMFIPSHPLGHTRSQPEPL